ncbi:uncharacterized protein LOC116196563 [Punica granatum]|uniref:Formin-like protein 18 n=2 Tax=Punica granatum TaxID=22663 RepID=A0A218X737_PUNGR|nr:uncharacterized protein LOC116196563 [Punica granatum]OWM80588.1 hypothetical protein CDL15_Pgr006618 [Punica granatum]PKI46955.1 hypothetical protein CRG98_032654 [Punica granatum]
MDPCPFVRLTVGGLALKIPVAAKPAHSVVHPTSTPCFCKIKLKHFPLQTAPVPTTDPAHSNPHATDSSLPTAAVFHLGRSDLARLSASSIFPGAGCRLRVSIYTGRRGTTCGVSSGRLLGKVSVPLDLSGVESKACVFHNGWVAVGKGGSGTAQFHLTVKAEPDPRFVFQFDGEPECSPQVFQIQGSIRQPVFTCKFSFRSTSDRNHLSRSLPAEPSCSRSWLSSFGSERERPGKERKGWSLTVHDLSGSPVATASMVTPFVASPGSDRVSRSNPGSWLILLPGDGTWKPWGRLEAWRERGSSDGLGLRFELIPESAGAGVVLAESTLSSQKGGKFMIDLVGPAASGNGRGTPVSATSPVCSPRGSGDYGNSLWPFCAYRGFVMSARVEGEGKCSKPAVEVSVQHVGCSEDAAAFVALAAAVDLSMDACRLFSQRLRKELYPGHDLVG